MSLLWANKIAKSALLSAQKHIDSVLDIKDENNAESGNDETENLYIEENACFFID